MEPVNLSQSVDTPIPENIVPEPGIGELYTDHKPLYDHFGAKPGFEGTDRQLAMIWEWGKENSPVKDDKSAILWEITKLSNRLGSSSFKDKPWVNLATYVSTWKQQRALESRLKEMEVHN